MRSIPVMTGFLTVGMLSFVGYILLSEGNAIIGYIALGFAALRAIFLGYQLSLGRRKPPER